MFFVRSRRPLIIVATLLQLLTHKITWFQDPHVTSSSHPETQTQTQEIIEECCDHAATITYTVTRTVAQKATETAFRETAKDTHQILPTELSFLEASPLEAGVCDVFSYKFSKLYQILDYFWWIFGVYNVWPLLMFFPRRRKEQRVQKERTEKEMYIIELEEKVVDVTQTLDRTIEEMSTNTVESSLAIGTLSALAEKRQLEILHEKEKVDLFIKQHLEFSDVRKDLRFAMEKLQEENNDLRAQIRDLSIRYQRIITDLPHLLLPPPIIAKSISDNSSRITTDDKPMITVVTKKHDTVQNFPSGIMDCCNE